MVALDSLPTEIILHIASFFSHRLDPLNSLCQTSKRLHSILEKVLYTEDIQRHDSSSVYWAAGRGYLPVLRKAMDLGKAHIPTHRDYVSNQAAYIGQRTDPLYGRRGPAVYRRSNREHPICRAAQNGHNEMVKFLLDEVGCSPHIRDWRDFCLVSVGIVGGLDKATIQILLDLGVHQYVKNRNGNCPLQIAASRGDEDMVVSLLSSTNPEYLEQQIQDSFHTALLFNQIPVALRLLDHGGVNLNCCMNRWTDDRKIYMTTPLGWAAFHGDLDLVNKFLDKGADADLTLSFGRRLAIERRVIFDAVESSQLEMVDYLVKRTSNRVVCTKALSLAVKSALPSNGPDSTQNKVVEILLRNGVSCNFEEEDIQPPPPDPKSQFPRPRNIICGWTISGKENGEFIPPIAYAVNAGNLRLVQLLLSYGADVNTCYRQLSISKSKRCCGRIVDLAKDLGHQEITDFLLKCGALPNLGLPPLRTV